MRITKSALSVNNYNRHWPGSCKIHLTFCCIDNYTDCMKLRICPYSASLRGLGVICPIVNINGLLHPCMLILMECIFHMSTTRLQLGCRGGSVAASDDAKRELWDVCVYNIMIVSDYL